MDNNHNHPQNFSLQDAKKFAQSDAGKQLFDSLQKTHGQEIQTAMTQAASGDMEELKNTLAQLMSNEQVKILLRQFRGDENG